MRIGIDIEGRRIGHPVPKIHFAKTIDIDTGEILTWTEASSLQGYLRDATLLVGHNGISYDFRQLTMHWSLKITIPTCDTLVLSRLLEPSREGGHSLEAWGERLGVKKTAYKKIWSWIKDRPEAYEGEAFDDPHMPLLEAYCEGDVRVLRELFLHLTKEKERLKFSDESVALEHRVAEIIRTQEENGFKLDVPHATCLLTQWKTRLSALAERAQELYPPVTVERYSDKTGKRLKDAVQTFNLGSRKQVAQKLMDLGWKPKKFTEKDNVIVDEAVLEEILNDA